DPLDPQGFVSRAASCGQDTRPRILQFREVASACRSRLGRRRPPSLHGLSIFCAAFMCV
ncbi:unnamed protein product, partial [Rangifer tarandus platyrhynchus]